MTCALFSKLALSNLKILKASAACGAPVLSDEVRKVK